MLLFILSELECNNNYFTPNKAQLCTRISVETVWMLASGTSAGRSSHWTTQSDESCMKNATLSYPGGYIHSQPIIVICTLPLLIRTKIRAIQKQT